MKCKSCGNEREFTVTGVYVDSIERVNGELWRVPGEVTEAISCGVCESVELVDGDEKIHSPQK